MKNKFLFLTWIVATILWGCGDKDSEGVIIEEGVPTYMSVSITFPKAGGETRTAQDPNATEDEVSIHSVVIFIYNNSGQFLDHKKLDMSKFTLVQGTEDQYVSSEPIPTTTGAKVVYAGINLSQSTVDKIIYQPMGNLSNVAHTFSMADLTTLSNGLSMFSVAGSEEDFVADPDDLKNHVSIDVKRLVAKITVEQSATMEQGGVPGELGDLEFAVNNFNTKMFLRQGADPFYKDPNWDSGTHVASDFIDTSASGYVTVYDLGNGTPGVGDYNVLYASENTSEDKLKKELTRVTVRSTFMPDKVTVVDTDPAGDGYKQEPRPSSISSPETFYSVTPGIGESTHYFYDKDVADQFAADKGGEVLTYEDGFCYWDMFLNKSSNSNPWDVLRNDYYKCLITRIVAPGRPTPDVPDPDVPPGADTSITTEINILFWTPVLDNYVLEP